MLCATMQAGIKKYTGINRRKPYKSKKKSTDFLTKNLLESTNNKGGVYDIDPVFRLGPVFEFSLDSRSVLRAGRQTVVMTTVRDVFPCSHVLHGFVFYLKSTAGDGGIEPPTFLLERNVIPLN